MEDEANRLQEMKDLQIVDTDFEEAFDRITYTVSKIFHVPTCLISFVTDDRQWFKSCIGLPEDLEPSRSTERKLSFCQYVVATKNIVVVNDARTHPWFSKNPLVEEYNLLFYAGAPIVTKQGNILGSLCIIDSNPREFSFEQQVILNNLSNWVAAELELRKKNLADGISSRSEKIISIASAKKAASLSNTVASRMAMSGEEAELFERATEEICTNLWLYYKKPFVVYWNIHENQLVFVIHYDFPDIFIQETLHEIQGMDTMKKVMDEIITTDTTKKYEIRFRKKIRNVNAAFQA
ncbi:MULTISPECIES: GAF domain-containing protein [unclassified Paenibacillus]|uniref:GAF domain-containing protein n=1 Tax=unclassified Paenibacillus TaxID=185978 RepID=UPI001AE12E23|nr:MULTISPECIES: GAF domain-containing protein [unclassified Paenibacillus]MBP1153914.1 signal transduction protein with GAF and PtsI domain [Paenibacillus sp. PvP091]MBP1170701.1 signal transduction protein with GAF and PtsI domain [Paenibacillus sp. PvR098]MBP2441729.1 signal transduction protein with GAF and PtsI domain [Paenibacillus sp. PvP052]